MKNNRQSILVLSIAVFIITIGVFGPLELYISNSDDIWFSLFETIKLIAIMTGAMILFFGLLCLLLKGKARAWVGICSFLLGTAFFIQGTFLNINLGALDGKSIDWDKYLVQGIINTLIWLAFFVVGILLSIRKEKLFSFIQKIGSWIVLLIETATIIVLLISSGNFNKVSNVSSYLTTDGIYSVGEDENVVVFVLDCFDEAFFEKALEQSDEYKTIFKDFIHYDNAAVAAATTKAALPAIITGKAYPGGISYPEYINQDFDSDSLYTELQKKGYDTRIYTDSNYIASSVGDRIANQSETGYNVKNYIGLALKYEKMTLYKYLPHILKPLAWMYTGDLEEYKSGNAGEAYKFDDVKYYHELMENKVQIIHGKTFRLFHLKGCHAPYIYDREVQLSDDSNVVEQARGSLKIVSDYLGILKKQGVYDKTAVIIMADHGEILEQFPQKNKAHGILLVKQISQKGEIMETSSAPISYWDLHDEVFSIITNSKEKGFSKITEQERKRMYYVYDTERGAVIWKEFSIQGNLNGDAKVLETGNVFRPDIQKENYKFGQELTFGNDAIAAKYIVSGVSATDEGKHSWTNAREVVFEFPLEHLPAKNLIATIKCAGVYNEAGPQILYLYANQVLCSKRIMNMGGTYQFIIPGKTIADDKQIRLKMILPYAASPRKLYGAGNRADVRTLGIALMGITLDETDQEATVETIPEISLNEEYYFINGEKEANTFFLMGLSKQEQSHSWTDGKHMIMEARIKETTEKDLSIRLSFSRVYNDQQHCRIRVGDTILFDETLSDEDREINFILPHNCLINDNEIHLIFELPDACSPKELGKGKDIREVAFALTNLMITEK